MGAAEAARAAEAWRSRGERLALAAGAFDLLDVRQARSLAALRAGLERLVVAVSDDVTAHSRLGPGRPVQPAAERGRLVAALRGVDAVVVTDPAGLTALIAALGPERIGTEGEPGLSGERIARMRAAPGA
jgi:bifunctional ADP-heptose synthase (sugar kinase/adenylyltransferase)